MKKLLGLGMVWNWGYIFVLFMTVVEILIVFSLTTYKIQPKTASPCEELLGGARIVIFASLLASIATVNGLFWYGLPLYVLYRKPTRRRAMIYTAWVILGTVVGLTLFFSPGIFALWSLTSNEYQYTIQEKIKYLALGLIELLVYSLLYAGSGLGYVWAYWRHLRQTTMS